MLLVNPSIITPYTLRNRQGLFNFEIKFNKITQIFDFVVFGQFVAVDQNRRCCT